MFDFLNDLQAVSTALGIIVVVFGAFLWLGNKIFKFGKISERLGNVEDDVAQIRKDVSVAKGELTKRIDEVLLAIVQRQVSDAHSPRQLNAEGNRILRESGIKEIIDAKFDDLLTIVRAQEPQNAYQGEQLILDAVQDLKNDDDLRPQVEKGAFRSGSLFGTVLYVGGIYIRDRILTGLGMNPADIDNKEKAV